MPESLSRKINDRIRAAAHAVEAGAETTFGFLCGCGCATLVVTTLDEYDSLDGHILKFGHSLRGPEIELAPAGFVDPRF